MTRTFNAVSAAVAAVAILVAPGLAPAASAQPITVKMATLVPEGSSWHLVLKEVADKWNKISGGKVRVIIYPSGTQGDDPDVVRKIRLGTLNAGVLTSVGLAEIDQIGRAHV
jgi:TRAP-type C4-dicarboxylate transport system substrate-binding protein